jgi:hypothetical protein
MRITEKECDGILDKVSGSSAMWEQKVDELICAIQSREEIEYIDEEE